MNLVKKLINFIKKSNINKLFKIIKKLFIISIIYFFLLILLSLLFPKTFFYIDNIRLFFQSNLLSFIGNRNVNTTPSRNIINTNELKYIDHKLKTADIFFTKRVWYASNVLIDWIFKHSVVYLWKKSEFDKFYKDNKISETIYKWFSEDDILIIDSVSEGVHIRKLEYLDYLDSIVAFRLHKGYEEKRIFLDYIISNVWKPYDFDFDTEDENAIFCSELIFLWLKKIWINIEWTKMFNRQFIYPNDIVSYIIENYNNFYFVLFIDWIQENPKYYTYKQFKKKFFE